MHKEKTEWGTIKNTGAGSMDLVILGYPIGQEFTISEVDGEIRNRGLQTRGAMGRHLDTLRRRGYVCKAGGIEAWKRIK